VGLDVPTLLVGIVLTDLTLAATLFIAVGRARGVVAWSASILVQAMAYAVIARTGTVNGLATIVSVNVAALSSFALQATALRAFHERPARPWALLAAAILLGSSFGLLSRWFALRVALASTSNAAGCAALAWLAHRDRARVPGAGVRILVIAFALSGVALMARAVSAVFRPEALLANATGALPASSALAGQMLAVMTALGFLLMQRERREQEIERLAMTDALTGAYNRRTLFDLGEREAKRAEREGRTLALVLLDLDHFKRINDTHGHPTGDAVLRQFAEIARAYLRKSDLLVRFGGEEFCVLLPGEDEAGALVVADRIRAAVESASIPVGDQAIRVTSSAGVAAIRPDAERGLPWLIRAADDALYRAKNAGRNRVERAAAN
jgi:diguanylate cyclase (GGDEF)-like protein